MSARPTRYRVLFLLGSCGVVVWSGFVMFGVESWHGVTGAGWSREDVAVDLAPLIVFGYYRNSTVCILWVCKLLVLPSVWCFGGCHRCAKQLLLGKAVVRCPCPPPASYLARAGSRPPCICLLIKG